MSNVIYRYTFDVFDDTYEINLMIGHDTTITPSVINLTPPQIKSYNFKSEIDYITGLPLANEFNIELNIALFNDTTKGYFYNATASLLNTLTLNNGKVIPFFYENTLEVKKNTDVIFYGVQERLEAGETDEDGFFNLKFICLLSKALQIIEPNEEFMKLSETADDDGRYLVDSTSATITYDIIIFHRYIFDYFYTIGGEARGKISIDRPSNFNAGICDFYDSVTIKYLFEYIGDIASELCTAWRRGTFTMSIDNPYNNFDFYKNSETQANTKGTLLAENDIRILWRKTANGNFTDIGEGISFQYNSVWDFLRILFEGLPLRFKYDYVNKKIINTQIVNTGDDLEITGQVNNISNAIRNEIQFIEVNNQYQGNNNAITAKGFDNNTLIDYTQTIKANNNGNLARLEIQSLYNNVPTACSANRIGRVWGSRIHNPSLIGYLRVINFGGTNLQTFHKIHHVVGVNYNGTDKYEPTAPTIDLDYKNATIKQNTERARVNNSITYNNTIRQNTTTPTIFNHVINTYLNRPSLTLTINTTDNLTPSDIGRMVSFSNYNFIPAWVNFSVTYGFIKSIEYDFELTKLEVILAN